jgi:VWFA-related protein
MSARFDTTVRTALAALSGLLLSTAAGTQPPPPTSPAPGLGFPARVDLVMVDVVVLDERGNPVEGLQAGDFVVREDGRPQTLASFEAVGLPESAPTLGPESLFVSTNRTGAARVSPRSFGVVFDDAQLSQPTGERARAALAKFIREQLRDDDEVILVSTATGAWWSARAGEGRSDLLAVLARLEGRRRGDTGSSFISDYEAMRLYLNRDQQIGAQVVRRFHEQGVILDPGTQAAAQSRQGLDLGEGHPLVRVKAAEAYSNAKQRNLATLRALTRLGDALAPGKGRKSVLLVSDGFVHDTTLPEFRSVVAAMSRANAAIYYLDARGLPGTGEHAAAEVGRATLEQDVLAVLGQGRLETEGAESVAIDTGGYSFRNPNDLLGGMEKIARESRSYYLIGYSSPNTRKDGKLRKIEVDVRRPGVKVRARKGYYAPGGARPEPATASRLDPQVRQALDSPFAIGGIGLRMASYVFGPASPGQTAVLVAVDADPESIAFERVQDRFNAELDSYLVVTERDTGQSTPQEKKIDLSLPSALRARIGQTWLPVFRELELPPGTYQARFLVHDRRGGRMGTVRHAFEVPPPAQLRTSTPILTDSLQGGAGGPRPVPLARRVFAADSNLLYLFEVYGARRDPASGGTRVQSRYEVRRADGSTLVRTELAPIPAGPQGQLARQTAVPLQGVAPGDYEIVLTVQDEVAGSSVEVRDPFSVVASPPSASPSSGRP